MMNLEIGSSKEITVTAKKKDSALSIGSGMLDVYSTPAMIALMERVSMELVQESLLEGFGSVGTMVNINHLKATKTGSKIRAKSTLIQQDRKRLVFKVEAFVGDNIIGLGEHERYIIEELRFLEKLI